ncbi:MAG: dynamin family protein [Pseudomonadota bacterium]
MTGNMNEKSSLLTPEQTGPRRPRIALMGEFSAGKSTLANLMVGTDPLPEQVVATQLPPVWISHGEGPSSLFDVHGREELCDLQNLQEIDKDDTAYIRIYSPADILLHCDLIDMPGISDPNTASVVWERLLPFADGVIWCTPATQAWRQSEAATWDGIDAKIREHSMLVITRSDMLLAERDRKKVQQRIRKETSELFAAHVMMSLHLARDAEIDSPQWQESGVDSFVETFLELVAKIRKDLPDCDGSEPVLPAPTEAVDATAISQSGSEKNVIVPRRPVARRRLLKDVPKTEQPAPEALAYMPKFS